ncbi:MAG: hypothetical protein LBL13_00415, partial [Bacteroidales bacterium]|nr:hypothetical protein [Bacteroidales bacterium]
MLKNTIGCNGQRYTLLNINYKLKVKQVKMKGLYILCKKAKGIMTLCLCIAGFFAACPETGKAQGGIEVFNYVSKTAGQVTASQTGLKVFPNREIEYVLEVRNLSTSGEAFSSGVVEVKIPYYANFYQAEAAYFQLAAGTDPVYNPVTRLITWNLSSIPAPTTTDSLFATLTYTLVSSQDCYALKATCVKEITVTGKFQGSGTSSSGVPFKYGERTPLVSPTLTPTVVTLDAASFISSYCDANGFDYREYVYLEEAGATIPVSDINADFPLGAKFYDTINTTTGANDIAGAIEYTPSNGFPKSPPEKSSYFAWSANNCWQKFYINVLDTSDIVFCAHETLDKARAWSDDWDALDVGKWYLGTESNLKSEEIANLSTR